MLCTFAACSSPPVHSAQPAAAEPPSPNPTSPAPTAVCAPEIHVDDTWTYRILDGFTHEPQGEVTHRVIEVAESQIVTQLRGSKSGKTSLRYFTRDWNILDAGELKSQITTWYAPAVRRFVRRQVTASRDGRVRSKSEDVLIEYGKAAVH